MRLISRFGGWIGSILGLAFCVCVGRVEAQEYCVACTEPPAVYRCIIEGARPGGSQPLQLLCVTAMAREGRHAICSVKGGTVFDCDGQVKRVPWVAHNAAAAEPKQETVTPPPAKDPAQPPQTVEEMVKRANEKTAEQFRRANEKMKDQAASFGQKLGDASKKTWRCISSFFTRCTE